LEFTTTITGSNTGTTYTVSGATPTTGTYGMVTTFTIAGGADGVNKMIAIADNMDGTCTQSVTVTGVTACFSCDAGAHGPRFLGLTRSTWMTIDAVTAIGVGLSMLLKKMVF